MFPRANVMIGAGELEWAAAQPFGHTLVPELYIRELVGSPQLRRIKEGEFKAAALPLRRAAKLR
jgi:N-acyl homoserine lactone hydrolase